MVLFCLKETSTEELATRKKITQHQRNIVEVKALREEVKRENHHELQCSSIPEIFSDTRGIHMDPCYEKYLKSTSKFVVLLVQRYSCSQVLAFEFSGCSLGYNSLKQLSIVFLKKLFFFKFLFLNCLIKLYR